MAPVSIDLTRLSEDELLEVNRRINERLRLTRSARQLVELARFTVGMHVEFTTDDRRILQGEITKLNRKAATICCNPSGHWRVSPSLPAPGDRRARVVSACRMRPADFSGARPR